MLGAKRAEEALHKCLRHYPRSTKGTQLKAYHADVINYLRTFKKFVLKFFVQFINLLCKADSQAEGEGDDSSGHYEPNNSKYKGWQQDRAMLCKCSGIRAFNGVEHCAAHNVQ